MTKCKGCGAVLQNTDENELGYTKDLNKELCERCFRIRNYNDYKFVNKDSEYYLNILKKIEKTNDLVILVTDFLNTDSLKDLKIKNPVLLALSKRDLIPRNLDENKLLSKINTNLNILDKLVVGSKNNYNLDLLFSKINKYKKSKDVYVIGYTNAGKSTLINKIIKNYGENKTEITTSILPSTTLDLINIKINKELNIIDTPGLLDKGSIILTADSIVLNKILPKKEIKPIVIQIKINQIIIVENILRLDVTKGTNLIFYMSNDLKIERFYKETDKLKNLPVKHLDIKKESDIVIKGLGFIKVTNQAKADLYIDNKINVNVRASII